MAEVGVGLSVVIIGSALGAATLIAAIIAAVASLLSLVPQYLELRQASTLRRKLTELLTAGESIRSLEWLGRRLGVSEREVAAMLSDVAAHGVKMEGGREGAALDSRHTSG